MSYVQSYVLVVNHDETKADEYVQETASALESRRITLIEVVQSLGDYINVEDATIRSRAITYLSHVIGRLPQSFLTRQQTLVLCEFLCNRIEDGGSMAGLSHLQSKDKFNKDMAVMTFRALIEHFRDLQTRPQPQRLQVLSNLTSLLSNNREAIKSVEGEAITAILDFVTGEKDPRNLMVAFSILNVVIAEWDISDYAEQLFDAVFCYFPITFRPPPDDPYQITAQELKDRLRACIAASGMFAPYVFPQLVDKLDSTSTNVKRDVLQTISACLSEYSVSIVSDRSNAMWDSLKFEILNMQEEELAAEALVALRIIAKRLSQDPEASDLKSGLIKYLRPIVRDCNEQLREPTHKQAKPVGEVLGSLATASKAAFTYIIKSILPPLETLYEDADDIAKRRALLEVLVKVLESAIGIYGTHNDPTKEPSTESPLNHFKDRLFALSSQALMSTSSEEVSFRIAALKILLRLCQIRSYMQDNEIGMFVQYLDDIVMVEDIDDRDELKKEAIGALVEISRLKPKLILDITVPVFMSKLPDSIEGSTASDYVVRLEGLAQLSVERSVSDTLIRRLLNKLDVVLQSNAPAAYPQAVLATLSHMLSQRDLKQDANLTYYYERIVVRLFRQIASSATVEDRESLIALNDALTLQYLGMLATRVIQALDEHRQSSAAMQLYSLFTEDNKFAPLPYGEDHPSSQKRSTMILSTSIMAGMSSTLIPQCAGESGNSVRSLIAELVRFVLAEDIPVIRQTLLRQIVFLVNKFVAFGDTQHAMDLLDATINALGQTAHGERAILVVFWVAKGLIARLSNVNEILERLLALLSNKAYSTQTARCFEILLAADDVFTKDNGAIIRLLAKQRVFNTCIPSISSQFRNADTSIKSNYLVALSGILKAMPIEIVMPEIHILLPLLLQSLDIDDLNVNRATIQSLTIITQESPGAIEGHIGSLVDRLLKATSHSSNAAAATQYSALECLRSLPGRVKDTNLLSYKGLVTRCLIPVLDDQRRHVRKAAVECRAAWFKMDDPQSD